MEKVLYFDYCAVLLLIVLLIATIMRGLTKGRTNKIFIELVLLGVVTAIADIFAVWLNRMGPGNAELKWIAHTCYLVFHCAASPAYMIYLLILSEADHKMGFKQRVLFSVPFFVAFVALITNLWHKKVFYLDEADAYTRGPWFGVLYVCAALYSIFGIYNVLRYRRLYGRMRFLALFGMFPIMMGAMIQQMVKPQVLCEMLANAVSLLLISMLVQRPEEILETVTGLGKESAYVDSMRRSMSTGKSRAVIMITLLNYSSLREILGYQGIHDLMRRLAKRLTSFNREHNYEAELYYIGNGRFRMVMDYRHMKQVEEAAGLLNRALKPDIAMNEMELNLVALVCVVKCPEEIPDMETLIAFGDDLNVRDYTGEVRYASELYKEQRYHIMRNMDSIIEQALSEHLFEVYYQPIYSVEEQRFNSAEALLRLKDKQYGFISPELFIPAAEKSGAIHRIGAYVMESVCQFIASEEYKELGLDYIEVNLSVTQCMRNNLSDEILETMKKYQIAPEQINLEITETAASYSQNTMMENIDALTSQGIHFSLDDYGTGYSNMRRIASMPFHLVKLDKSFTDLNDNPKLLIVVKNTIHMIKDMNMKIVVEGIETEQLVRQFSELKCEYIQGYYYSKPIPRGEFVKFILDSKNKKNMVG